MNSLVNLSFFFLKRRHLGRTQSDLTKRIFYKSLNSSIKPNERFNILSFTNFNKKLSGGGILIDWGVHCIDLISYILNLNNFNKNNFLNEVSGLFEYYKTKINGLQKIYLDKRKKIDLILNSEKKLDKFFSDFLSAVKESKILGVNEEYFLKNFDYEFHDLKRKIIDDKFTLIHYSSFDP